MDTARDFLLDSLEADHRDGICTPDCLICEAESLSGHVDEGGEA